MSTFGSPGKLPSTKPTPPQRGSFPLDHDGKLLGDLVKEMGSNTVLGECKHVMKNYLACMKQARGVNEDQCRDLAKAYLACRMDRNLMARDDFKNLGFQEGGAKPEQPRQGLEPEKGVKGELHW